MCETTLLLTSVFSAGLLLPLAESHGALSHPRQWADVNGEWPVCPINSVFEDKIFHCGNLNKEEGCESIIRQRSEMTDEELNELLLVPSYDASVKRTWFTNYTFIPGEKTLDPSMRSYPQLEKFGDPEYDRHPWMSPGSAPVVSGCGASGGNPDGLVGTTDLIANQGGWSYGPLAEDFYMAPGFPDVVTTEWKAGSVEEASWWFFANHGGGYSYRLCKVPEEGMVGLTEECFKRGQLDFFGDKQWVQYEKDGEKTEIEALRTREGTFPEGSQWTRSPVPTCNYDEETGPDGETFILFPPDTPGCSSGSQFESPLPHIDTCGIGTVLLPPHIIDQLVVPEDLTPGDYVLSFRWDCEQTDQIYTSCANIRMVE